MVAAFKTYPPPSLSPNSCSTIAISCSAILHPSVSGSGHAPSAPPSISPQAISTSSSPSQPSRNASCLPFLLRCCSSSSSRTSTCRSQRKWWRKITGGGGLRRVTGSCRPLLPCSSPLLPVEILSVTPIRMLSPDTLSSSSVAATHGDQIWMPSKRSCPTPPPARTGTQEQEQEEEEEEEEVSI